MRGIDASLSAAKTRVLEGSTRMEMGTGQGVQPSVARQRLEEERAA